MLIDDELQAVTHSVLIQRILWHHDNAFFLPIVIAGLLSMVVLGTAVAWKKLESSFLLLLIPFWTGIIYVCLFLQGASVHEYWLIYLAPGYAVPIFGVLALLGRQGKFPRVVAVFTAIGTMIAVTILSFIDAQERLSVREHRVSEFKIAGLQLDEFTKPNEIILTTLPEQPFFIFYCNRVYAFNFVDVEMLLQYGSQHRQLIGGYLIRASEAEALDPLLSKLQGFVRRDLGAYVFWDANP